MINKNKSIKIVYLLILTIMLQIFIPMGSSYSFAEEVELGNIFTFNSLKLGDKDTGVEITGDSPIDVSDGTSVYLEYSWNTIGLGVESGDWSQVDVPDAFIFDDFPEADIIVSGDTGNVNIGEYTLIDGILKFVFNENIETFGDVNNGYVGFALEFNMETFEEDVVHELEFNDTENKTLKVTVIPSSTVSKVEKTGKPDANKDPKNITWSLDISNTEDTIITNPSIYDIIPDGLKLNDESIEIYDLNIGYYGDKSLGMQITSGPLIKTGDEVSTSGASIEIVFGDMNPYEGYRIKYTTEIEDYTQTSFSNEAYFKYDDSNFPAVATVNEIERSEFIEKDGRYLGNNEIQWTIDINKAGGDIDEAYIYDTLPAGLTLKDNSIEIYTLTKSGNLWNESLDETRSFSSFPLNLGQVTSDDAYRIKFTSNMDYSTINNGDYQTVNTFVNTGILKDGETLIGDADKTVTINRDPVIRKSGKSNVGYDDKSLTWTIYVNEANHNIENAVITDEIPIGLGTSPSAIEANLKVYDKDGTDITSTVTISVSDNTLTVDLGNINEEYKIVYTTVITDFTLNSFTNGAEFTGDGIGSDDNTADKTIYPAKNTYRKQFISIDYNNRTIDWKIAVNPKREAISELTITDTFPNDGLILLNDTSNPLKVKLGTSFLESGTDFILTPVMDSANTPNEGYHNGFILEFKDSVLPLNDDVAITYTTSFDPEKEVDGNFLIANTDNDSIYKNSALFEVETINGNTIDISKEASKKVIFESWNSGKKESKLISIDSDGTYVDGWISGNERNIEWGVYINYLEEELGSGVEIEDTLQYEGQINEDSIHIYSYDVNSDGTTSIDTSAELDSNKYSTLISADGKSLTLSFETAFEISERYVIVFNSSVPDISANDYTNNASLTTLSMDTYTYTASIGFDKYNDFLSKEALSINDNKVYTDQEVDWNITINDSLSIIQNAQITDTVSSGMVYKNDSLKIYKLENTDRVELTEGSDQDYTLEVDTSGDTTVLTINFNETIKEYTYEIEYTTLITEEDGIVNNSVEFSGTSITIDTVESQQLNASKFSYVGGDPAKGKIKLLKVDEDDTLITSSNAEFKLWYKFNDEDYLFENETFQNEDGILEIGNLPLNRTYYIEEVTSPEGYLKTEEKIPILVDTAYNNKDENIYEIKVENTKIKGNIEFLKVDEWDSSLTGVEFALYNSENTEIDTASSDEDGKVLFEDIEYGDYTIKEITPAEGYLSNTQELKASITESDHQATVYAQPEGTTSESIYSLVNIIKKGSLKITKVSTSDSTKKLSDAEFKIFEVVDDAEIYVDTIISQSDGIAEKNDLPYGDYIVKESKAPSGYKLNSESRSIQIINNGDIIEETFENKKKSSGNSPSTGSLTIIKTDSDYSDISLQGAVFEVRDSDGDLVSILVTDTSGEARADDLSMGNYTIIETTPPDGYTYDETEYEIFIGYTLDVEIQITNEKAEEIVPTDPVDPTDPTDPVDPENPTDPTDPVDPENPTDPTDPVDPENPTDPTDPTNPEETEIPSDGATVIHEGDPGDVVEIIVPPKDGEAVVIDEDVYYIPDEDYDGDDAITIKIWKDDESVMEITIEIDDELVPIGIIEALPDTGSGLKIFIIWAGLLFATIIGKHRINKINS